MTKWTVVVVTCLSSQQRTIITKELNILQEKGVINQDAILLVVEDPQENLGSGGATINALVVATEYLSAQQNYTVINPDVLKEANIIIMHHGRSYPFEPLGKSFISLPISIEKDQLCASVLSNMHQLLGIVNKMAKKVTTAGVWVCSTDMILVGDVDSDWVKDCNPQHGCVLFTVPADVQYAVHHGVIKTKSDSNLVSDIIYQGSLSQLQSCIQASGQVNLVAGIVLLSVKVAESLLILQATAPLDGCTYLGLDSGADQIPVSLFFDILDAMASEMTEEAFLAGECGKMYSNMKRAQNEDGSGDVVTRSLRKVVWDELRCFPLQSVNLENMKHFYWSENRPLRHQVGILQATLGNHIPHVILTHSIFNNKVDASSVIAINSFLEDVEIKSGSCPTCIQNCKIKGPISIAGNCYMSGLSIDLSEIDPSEKFNVNYGTALMSIHMQSPFFTGNVFILLGVNDVVTLPIGDRHSTICNIPWEKFLAENGICRTDLWNSDMPQHEQTLFNASLFPINDDDFDIRNILWIHWNSSDNSKKMKYRERWRESMRVSLETVVVFANLDLEMQYRKELFHMISGKICEEVISGGTFVSLQPYWASAVVEQKTAIILDHLDELVTKFVTSLWNPGKTARVLANIANVLAAMAGNKGGLRSGPAANKDWKLAFEALKDGSKVSIQKGVYELKRIRSNWMESPDRLVRASRHYEGAAQILVQHAVFTAKEYVHLEQEKAKPDVGVWVNAECPARIDLLGGWTDTPPICYEMGGSVVNMSITVNGKKPIGAKIRRTPEMRITLVESEATEARTYIDDVESLQDYNQPNAAGALLKGCIIFAELISCCSSLNLVEQLQTQHGSGFEIHTWSRLPRGSGLGTSSILAGAILAAIWTITGKRFDRSTIIHAVLCVDQMLTTGGGWQDTVGGIFGGVLHGTSKPQFPLKVEISKIELSRNFIATLNRHLVLLFTGKIRLARNLLQNVVRNWYARDEQVFQTLKDLYNYSLQCAKAFEEESFDEIGKLIGHYWELKKALATGAEPTLVRDMMKVLRPHVYAQALCGAGGGGFMFMITKEPDAQSVITDVLSQVPGVQHIELYTAALDEDGICISVGNGQISFLE